MKEIVDHIDATPTKKLFRSIIVDYTLETAIAELIDNAIDAWTERRGGPDLAISINIDTDQQSIIIRDNAGGVSESDLRNLISPGASSSDGSTGIIGIFGVGSKRAAVVLAQQVSITTRRHKKSTFRLEYDEDWIDDSENWSIPYYRVDTITPSSTSIDLSKLRFRIDEEGLSKLRDYLAATYFFLLRSNPISITLNDEPIVGLSFDNWSYPPGFPPHRFKRRLPTRNSKKKIRCEITAGLVLEKGYEHGVYIYCNDRLICRALKSPQVGFAAGRTGHHVEFSLARIIVKLHGASQDMPWNSSKSGINYNSPVFQAIRDDLLRAAGNFTQLSRRLFKDFDEAVLPYTEGTIKEISLPAGKPIKPSRLPKIPKAKKSYKDQILELNRALAKKDRWVRGLCEAIIAEEMISRQRILKQKNRISIIILDSTLEIAFKDYLAWRIPSPLGDKRIEDLFGNRIEVQKEVRKHLNLDGGTWNDIEFFYKMRCDLVHRKVSAEISNEDIQDFRRVVKEVLATAFTMRFP